jgi:hypothetical protein
MTDMRLSVAGSERERALLRAGAEEAPSTESVQAAARVLGIVPRAAIVAYAIAALFKSVKWSSVVGYVLAPAAAVAGVATVGYVVATGAAPRAPSLVASPAPHAAVQAPAVAATPPAPVEPAVRADVPVATPAAPVAKVAPHARVVRAEPPARAAEVSQALQQQIDLIDRARRLEASADTGGALRTLDEFDRRFARGPMSEEAGLLRIQATAARGDRAAASALAQRFLAEHPASVHAAKVRSIAGDGAN